MPDRSTGRPQSPTSSVDLQQRIDQHADSCGEVMLDTERRPGKIGLFILYHGEADRPALERSPSLTGALAEYAVRDNSAGTIPPLRGLSRLHAMPIECNCMTAETCCRH